MKQTKILKPVVGRKQKQTVRERMDRSKSRRISLRGVKKLATKTKGIRDTMGKTYHLPLPDNKAGNILSKKVVLFPGFLKNSFKELRLVEWPDMRTTLKLSFAVIIFSVLFSSFIGVIDFGLGKLFKEVLLKK